MNIDGHKKKEIAELFNRDRRTIYDIIKLKRYKDYGKL